MSLNFGQRLKALSIGIGLAFSGRGITTVGASSQSGFFPSLTNPTKKHGAAWLKMYGEHPWLHSAINRIAETVASASWHLYTMRGKTKTEILDHPFLALHQRPNPESSGYIFRQLTQAYMEIQGEAFWLYERNKAGVIAEIWPVPPTWVLETPRPDFEFYRVNLRGKQFTIPKTEMIWFKIPSLTDPYARGLGTAEAAGDDIEADEYAAKWNKRFFSNSARPDVALTPKSMVTPEQAERLKTNWVEKMGGFWNAFKPAVIGPDVGIEILTKGQQEMDFVESRKFSRDNVIGAFGIPASVLGIVENVNRANAETGDYTFNKNIIKPRLIFWRDEYNAKIIAPEFGKGFYLDFEDPVPENRDATLAEANAGMAGGAITVNEWRGEMGYDPRPDGDVFLLPFSLTPTASLRASVSTPEQKQAHIQVVRSFRSGISNEEWERRWTIFIRRTNPREKNYQRILAAFWQDQQDEVEAKIKAASRAFDGVKGKPEDFLFDSEAWGELLNEKSKPVLFDSIKAAAQAALEDIGAKKSLRAVKFDLYDERVKTYISRRLNKYLGKKITDQVRDALKAELAAGYEAGEGIPQIMDRVGSVYEGAKGWQAERIARTEIIGSSNYGANVAYSQAGVELKAWLAALDERTRETHIEAHMQYQANPIPVEADFEVGGGAGPCPGNIGTAEEDCNCRCTEIPVIPEIENS